jgi:hypothetical protein
MLIDRELVISAPEYKCTRCKSYVLQITKKMIREKVDILAAKILPAVETDIDPARSAIALFACWYTLNFHNISSLSSTRT